MARGAQYNRKENQNDPKGTPKTPQREARDALEQPCGVPGEALERPGATISKMNAGTLFSASQMDQILEAPGWIFR